MDIRTIGIIAIGAMLVVFNLWGTAMTWWRRSSDALPSGVAIVPHVDSDRRPTSEAMDYIDSISEVPATAEQTLKALQAGQSVAEFMRSLLQVKGPA